MAQHFKWYPSDEEVVVPWNARYSFPSQANKAVKLTPRIPPKSGTTFTPGSVMRLEFPAQGYVNPQNTTLEFDVTMSDWGTPNACVTRFQNNIQSLFSRVRLLYGATPIEDIINYNTVVRALTEWTATNQSGTMDQTSIAEGIGGVAVGTDGNTAATTFGLVNVRQAYIQGIDNTTGTAPATSVFGAQGVSHGTVFATRRYQVSFALGVFTQSKLIPTKFMASQLAIEITLESPAGCMVTITGSADPTGSSASYSLSNVNLIPEILEFDASYDAMFLKGLREGGVPIKFSSWHTYIFSTGGSATLNLQIQERSRSVKALFAVQRKGTATMFLDSHAMLFSTGTGVSTLQSYQYRIGGRYFPAAPVQCSTNVGGNVSNGGCEAFTELQKALNQVGDYRLSTSVNATRWGLSPFSAAVGANSNSSTASDLDYAVDIGTFAAGVPSGRLITGTTNPFSGSVGSACFAMAIDLETSNGTEISGLNAEEQSDISLLVNYSVPQTGTNNMEVYAYYDAMLILRENNVLELIQ